MVKVKGSAIKATLAFLEKHAGEAKTAEILARLDPGDRQMLEETMLVGNWYDLKPLLHLMAASEGAVEVPQGRTVAWEIGRFSADFGLKTIYRLFIKLADPGFVVRKATQLFSTNYDSGSMDLVKAEPHEAVMRLTGFEEPDARFCQRLLGFMQRSLELSGAKNVRMDHPKCEARGDGHCEFMAKWD